MTNQEDLNLEMGSSEKEEKKKKRLLIWLLLFLVIVTAIVLLILKPWVKPALNIGVRKGMPTSMSSLEDFIKEGQSNVILNPSPTFEDGSSVGSIAIANQPANNRDMQLKIFLEDESIGGNNLGNLLYESPIIPPNHYIDGGKLIIPLNKGVYPAVAQVTFYHDGEATTLVSYFSISIVVKN